MKKIITILALISLCLPALSQNKWEQVCPGVWKMTVGTPEEYTLLSVSGSKPFKDGFSRLPEGALPKWAVNNIRCTFSDGKTILEFPLQRKEQIYGFGLNFENVNQRGKILRLHADHYGKEDNGRTHAPVPFYLSSLGYGIFIDSARYIDVYAGYGSRKDSPNAPEPKDRNTDKSWTSKPYSDAVSVLVPAAGVDVYLFTGPEPMQALRRFNLFMGGGPLPPRWGLGFTQRVHRFYTAEQALSEADEFEKRGYPLDFLGLEPGWQSKAYPCTFEWDPTRYPSPAEFVSKMKDKGVRVNLWTNPYVSPDSDIYEDIYPLTGSHTVWCGLVPDFAMPRAREIFAEKFEREHVSIGVGGYKIDEVDGYDRYLWPDVATFPSGTPSEQLRQTYGLWVQRITDEIYRKNNTRTFGLVRSSNAGGVRFPYVIYNDSYSHQAFITALINSGFCGVLWTPEVRSSDNPEEWLRRFQSVVFSPMAMINAWASGTKPWSFPEVADNIREYALLRMQMMPYWYSEFARYHFDGIPPFYAVNLEMGDKSTTISVTVDEDLEKNPYRLAVTKELNDEYMAGGNLLVAPMFTGQTSRKVVLPPGDWYDFYTGDLVGNNETIEVTPGLERIPVYVRDGAIIPMMTRSLLHAPAAGEKFDLEIRHYGKAEGSYLLYDDDGETFDYESGAYSWRTLEVRRDKKGRLGGSISKAEKGKPDNIGKVSWKFMTE